jgi:8-oxo-dGTP diphosphatase
VAERSIDRSEPPTRVGIGLVCRDGCFLIRQRPPGAALSGLWEFPGGKCEPGEPTEEAARRECREETGLDVEVGTLRRVVEFDYPHGRVELYYYDCVTRDPVAQPAAESGFRWVPAVAFASLDFPEANRPVVDALMREYRADPGRV